MQILNVNNVIEFLDAIARFKSQNSKKPKEEREYFFRGQKNVQWSITPSISRHELLTYESEIIQEAIRENQADFDGLSPFNTLAKLQHYGLCTRLIDVTLNPLVALFFACQSSENIDPIYNGLYISSLLSGVPCSFYNVSIKKTDGVVFVAHSEFVSDRDNDVNTLIETAYLENEGLKGNDLFAKCAIKFGYSTPYDIDSISTEDHEKIYRILTQNYFIIPSNAENNTRLKKQNGAFLLTGYNCHGIVYFAGPCQSEPLPKIMDEFCLAIIIPQKSKGDILKELDSQNINQATLFPELENKMAYIIEKAKEKYDTSKTFEYVLRTPEWRKIHDQLEIRMINKDGTEIVTKERKR